MPLHPQEQPTYPSLPSTLILTSTKSYFSPARTLAYLEALLDPANKILPLPPDILFGLIPDHLTIHACAQRLAAHTTTTAATTPAPTQTPDENLNPVPWPLYLGAQDVSAFPSHGAYTGFVVAPSLAALGVRIVELGHAERRRHAYETDASTAAKAAVVCAHAMVPLVCVGETAAPDPNSPMSANVGGAMRQLAPQVQSVLRAVPPDAPVILAYEPVWAIGAARPAGVDFVGPVVGAIREVVKSVQGRTGTTRVVYGGSAGPGLWSGKTNGGDGLGKYVDGMFLGRFAHEIAGVQAVVEEVKESISSRQG
jgi:triosephosphate isomerase (TIM)